MESSENARPGVSYWTRQLSRFAGFISMFFIFMFILHLYVFLHLSYMFKIPHNFWFWLFLVLISLMFIFTMIFGYTYGNLASRAFSIIGGFWLGFVLIMLFILMLYDGARFFIDIDPYIAGQYILIITAILTAYGSINAQVARVREVKIRAGNLPPEKNLRIAHISDIHLGPVHGTGFLKRLVAKTNALKPDVVLITGDLADGASKYTEESFAPLNDLNAPAFFTIGNHDIYAGLDWILELVGKTKVQILRNEAVELKNIQIIGIDYGWGKGYVGSTLKPILIDRKKFSILLSHMPGGLEDANKAGVNLVLSGHTHGGQFIPIVIVAKLLWRYNKGLYKQNGTYLYTSQGIGTWGPPIRLGTNSEIALIRVVGGR
ncbi:MAG: metallophosphoesterase [Thermoplasmata archaeon]|nr:MAG: metallophosphoesterase [Thermoplasmata archaeon]